MAERSVPLAQVPDDAAGGRQLLSEVLLGLFIHRSVIENMARTTAQGKAGARARCLDRRVREGEDYGTMAERAATVRMLVVLGCDPGATPGGIRDGNDS